MAHSTIYTMYKQKLERCQSPDELLKICDEINKIPFRAKERTALLVSAVLIAKYFDKHGAKPKEAAPEGGVLDVV